VRIKARDDLLDIEVGEIVDFGIGVVKRKRIASQ
jgi:hypothetical protein